MNSILELVVLALLCCLANISYSNSGLVSAIMWQVVWQIAGSFKFGLASNNIQLATVLILASKLSIAVLMFCLVLKHIDFRIAALLGIPSTLTSLLGVELLL